MENVTSFFFPSQNRWLTAMVAKVYLNECIFQLVYGYVSLGRDILSVLQQINSSSVVNLHFINKCNI